MLLFVVSCVDQKTKKNTPSTGKVHLTAEEVDFTPDEVHLVSDEVFLMYQSLPDYKAIAIARDKNGVDILGSNGGKVVGYAGDYKNVHFAVKRALEECSGIVQKLALDATCKIYAIGNKLKFHRNFSYPSCRHSSDHAQKNRDKRIMPGFG